MSLKGYRATPYPIGTPEWDSFKNFAVEYYLEAIEIAVRAIKETRNATGPFIKEETDVMLILLDKTSSPLVFLWEKWQLMSMEERLKYATCQYRERLKQKIREARKTAKEMHEKLGSSVKEG